MNKYIICDTATSEHGKTKTLLKVIEELKKLVVPDVEEPIGNEEDIYASFSINGKRIVVDTMGDPVPNYKTVLWRACEEKADIIVCASRTKGNTFWDVDNLTANGYELIRFSNFYTKNDGMPYESSLSCITADAIVKLINLLMQ